MNKEAVFHKINSNYSYMLNASTLRVILRTALHDIQNAEIVYYNRFNSDNHSSKKMSLMISSMLFDFYYVDIIMNEGSIVYFFALQDFNQQLQYYGEFGFYATAPKRVGSFEMLSLHKSELNPPPVWLYDSVFYQIFPDRFCKKDNDEPELVPWGAEPDYYTKFGGNFKGITSKIPYLKALGVNAIYLTPIFLSQSCHRYDIIDYYSVDPLLGTKEQLQEMVQAFHDNGIRVIFDAVFNHSSNKFFAFADVVKNGKDSKYKDWFYIDKFPLIEGDKKNYLTFAQEHNMPRINTENPEVADYLIDSAVYWTKLLDLDGWRLDVADEVCSTFWRKFRQRIKAINPNILILGEIWHNGEYFLHNKFDSIMNYPFYQALKQAFIDVATFKDWLTHQMLMYPYKYTLAQFNIIDSHDTARAMTECALDRNKFMQLAVLQFTFCGVPCIYYGDENGMEGGDDPFNRRCMDWQHTDAQLQPFFKSLIALRKSAKSLKFGDFKWLDSNGIAFSRSFENETIKVYVNTLGSTLKIIQPIKDVKLSFGYKNGKLLQGGYLICT